MPNLKLVKYGHEYCGPCKVLAPIIKSITEELADIVDFEDKNTYSLNPDEIANAGIRAVPTMILYKNDIEIWRHVGLMNSNDLRKVITDNQ